MVCFFLSLPKSCFLWDVCMWNVWEIPPEQIWSGNGFMSLIRDMENICLISEIGIPSFSLYEIYVFLSILASLYWGKTFSCMKEIHSAFGSLSAPVPCHSWWWWQWWALPSVSPSVELLNGSLWLPRLVGLLKIMKITLNASKEGAEERLTKTGWYHQGTGLFRIADGEQYKVDHWDPQLSGEQWCSVRLCWGCSARWVILGLGLLILSHRWKV